MLISLLLAAQAPAVNIDYLSRAGLQVRVNQVPVLRGSFFQVYEPGWTKGYYSSNWNEQTVTRSGDVTTVRAQSGDGRTNAEFTFTRTEKGMRAVYRVTWTGENRANLELSFGHVWAPAVAQGTIQIDGQPGRSPAKPWAITTNEPKDRTFGPDGNTYVFDAPLATLRAKVTGTKAELFDARGYRADFAEGRELFWFGAQDIALEPGKPAEITVDWEIIPKALPTASSGTLSWEKTPLNEAWVAREKPLPPIPKPKSMQVIQEGLAFQWAQGHSVTGEHALLARPVVAALREKWSGLPERGSRIDLSIRDLKLRPGGYRLNVSRGILRVVGQDIEGVRNGLWRAANLARPMNGQLGLPALTLTDEPAIHWRGAHLFVGPDTPTFHLAMAQRLYAPLLFNQIVLQAERTKWDTIPGTATPMSMSKKDLRTVVENWRSQGIEPTPLIQSFGHMGWLFANGKNTDVAFNPNVLFSIDPRKPRGQELLRGIWRETVDIFRPKILHFGLDEVDMRGWPNDPKLVTELWGKQVDFLETIAKEHKAEMMVWGDQLLAPGQAPDATNGHNAAEARARRDALPRGAYIADWHYKNDANPAIYKSLELFQNEGLKPVASTWYRRDNIKGFFAAAADRGAGALQTTWAGYESNEANMVREFDQMVSYVLAGEYAWSNRPERPDNLPYRADLALRHLYGRTHTPLKPMKGTGYGVGMLTRRLIGDFQVAIGQSVPFVSALRATPGQREISIPLSGKIRQLVVVMSCDVAVDPMTSVAEVVIEGSAGAPRVVPVMYGRDIRATGDAREALRSPREGGLFAVRIPVTGAVSKVTIRGTSPAAGAIFHGLTAMP